MMQKPHPFSSPTSIQNEAILILFFFFSEQIGVTPGCKCSSRAKRGGGGGRGPMLLVFFAAPFPGGGIWRCLPGLSLAGSRRGAAGLQDPDQSQETMFRKTIGASVCCVRKIFSYNGSWVIQQVN